MDTLIYIFGQRNDLNVLQMSCRGVVVFFIALILIRLSGRRSFGLHNPLDNIIIISLGATLSRAIVGASAFVPVVITCFVIVLLHRLLGWLFVRNPGLSMIIEGKKILLFKNGKFIDKNLKRALVCHEDVMQGIRKLLLTEDMDNIDEVYLERNGEISAIKKS
ncbi:DUF421 domain-containing protein [Mucilaginibacter puniceus]